MKRKKTPAYLHVLPKKEVILPDWEKTNSTAPTTDLDAIGGQMNKLHHLSDALFAAIIALEVNLLLISKQFDPSVSLGVTLALIITAIIVGLFGGLLMFAMLLVETNVRHELDSLDDDVVKEGEYVIL